jgi:hypothetical protein
MNRNPLEFPDRSARDRSIAGNFLVRQDADDEDDDDEDEGSRKEEEEDEDEEEEDDDDDDDDDDTTDDGYSERNAIQLG